MMGKGGAALGQRLRRACYEGSEAKVGRLLALGADPNGTERGTGFFPLERAAVCDRSGVLAMLVEAGAEIDKRGGVDGLTPLMLAAWDGARGTVEELLRLGADPQAQAPDGSVALHYACREGFRAVAEAVMAAGGWSARRDKMGRTPLDIAISAAVGPGLVASMAARSAPSELAETLSIWEPWRLHRLEVAEGRSDPEAGAKLVAGAWALRPELAMERLAEAREVMSRWEERGAIAAELPEAKRGCGSRI